MLNDVRPAVFPDTAVDGLQPVFRHIVVAVHKADILRPGLHGPGAARLGQAAVGLVYDGYPRVRFRVLVADGGAIVGRAVVHQNQLEIRIGLGQNAVHAGTQIGLHLIDGNNDGISRLHEGSFQSAVLRKQQPQLHEEDGQAVETAF